MSDPWLTQDVLAGKLIWNEQGCAVGNAILMHLCGCVYLCCQDTYSYNFIGFLKRKKNKGKKKKKLSTEAPAYAKCCCQDFNSHEADADSECHSRLDGVTLGSPVKEKNQTDFKTATALCHVGLCLLELCPLASSEAGLAVIPNTLTTDLQKRHSW